jgi:hypothetical protein
MSIAGNIMLSMKGHDADWSCANNPANSSSVYFHADIFSQGSEATGLIIYSQDI